MITSIGSGICKIKRITVFYWVGLRVADKVQNDTNLTIKKFMRVVDKATKKSYIFSYGLPIKYIMPLI